jgi:hypothetical protein
MAMATCWCVKIGCRVDVSICKIYHKGHEVRFTKNTKVLCALCCPSLVSLVVYKVVYKEFGLAATAATATTTIE